MDSKITEIPLPKLNKRATKQKLESLFAEYRTAKYFPKNDFEASVTTNYEERFHGPTNEKSDQTAQIVAANVEAEEKRKQFVERVEQAVSILPSKEQDLIRERYMRLESDYITDYSIYRHKIYMSEGTYAKIRWRAFYKLALSLNAYLFKTEDLNKG